MIEYTLSRSNRKTVAIYIRDGLVEVRAPLKMPSHAVERFVTSKEKWIAGKLVKSAERVERKSSFELSYGVSVIYRGKPYPIAEKQGSRIGFDNERFYMPPGLTPEQIKHACIQIYRMLAKNILTEKAIAFAKIMSVAPAAVKINSAKTRWGSCSAKKSVNFSWLLVMADDDIIDYVVVHELAHITELNHSARFWSLVEGIIPDYARRKAKLKDLQHRLAGEDWD